MSPSILLVDDDPQMLRAVRSGLEANEYHVMTAMDGEEALRTAAVQVPDVVLLDLGLPKVDGLEFCKRYRVWSQAPVIVLSVAGEEQKKIAALDLGADDYLTKPFGMGELLARIRAALRRTHSDAGISPARREIGDLVVDIGAHLVTRGGSIVHLTPTEFDLLAYLIQHEGKVLSRLDILEDVWNHNPDVTARTIDNFVLRLRKIIEVNPASPRHILSIRGTGYRFVAHPSEANGPAS